VSSERFGLAALKRSRERFPGARGQIGGYIGEAKQGEIAWKLLWKGMMTAHERSPLTHTLTSIPPCLMFPHAKSYSTAIDD
jgi:hypothetical protein